jgi:hypothetical protein
MLNERINHQIQKIFARQTEIKPVDQMQRKQFFNENHIDGDVASKISFGCFYNGNLVACISLRKPLSKKWKNYIEIARSATIKNVRIIGGLGKLIKHVSTWTKDQGYDGILTYVDLRYGDGHGYEAVGFTNAGLIKNFWWTDYTSRYDRSHCKATEGLSEKTHAEQLGLKKIWGWGHARYILHFKECQ